MEWENKIRKSYIPTFYPEEPVENFLGDFKLDSDMIQSFDPAKHNSIQVVVSVYPIASTPQNAQYSIPQAATFISHFRINSPIDNADFQICGVSIKSFGELIPGIWYNLYDCPINIYTVPYGQRFINIKYKFPDDRPVLDIKYIACDNSTHLKALELDRYNREVADNVKY